jgi:hypothetical protein
MPGLYRKTAGTVGNNLQVPSGFINQLTTVNISGQNLTISNLIDTTNIQITNNATIQENINLSGDLNMSCGTINDVSNIVFCNDASITHEGPDVITVSGNLHILGDLIVDGSGDIGFMSMVLVKGAMTANQTILGNSMEIIEFVDTQPIAPHDYPGFDINDEWDNSTNKFTVAASGTGTYLVQVQLFLTNTLTSASLFLFKNNKEYAAFAGCTTNISGCNLDGSIPVELDEGDNLDIRCLSHVNNSLIDNVNHSQRHSFSITKISGGGTGDLSGHLANYYTINQMLSGDLDLSFHNLNITGDINLSGDLNMSCGTIDDVSNIVFCNQTALIANHSVNLNMAPSLLNQDLSNSFINLSGGLDICGNLFVGCSAEFLQEVSATSVFASRVTAQDELTGVDKCNFQNAFVNSLLKVQSNAFFHNSDVGNTNNVGVLNDKGVGFACTFSTTTGEVDENPQLTIKRIYDNTPNDDYPRMRIDNTNKGLVIDSSDNQPLILDLPVDFSCNEIIDVSSIGFCNNVAIVNDVSNAITVSGNLIVLGDLIVNNIVDLQDVIITNLSVVNNFDASSIEISNSLVIGQNIDISGDLNMSCGTINDVSDIVFCNDVAIVNQGQDTLTVSGNFHVSGDLIVNNTVSLQDVSITNLSVVNNFDASSIEISNSLVVGQNIDVSGDLNMSCGIINDVSDIVFCNGVTLINDGSDILTISGNLVVTGEFIVNNNVDLQDVSINNLSVANLLDVNLLDVSLLDVNLLDANSIEISNSLVVGQNINVSGDLNMSCGTINDVSTIVFCNQVSVVNDGSNAITVSGNLLVLGDLIANNTIDLQDVTITNLSVTNNLDVSSIEISNSLVVHQNIDVSGDLNMSCGTINDVSNIVFCNGVSLVNDGSNAITVSGNFQVSGDLIVNNTVSLQDVSITNLSVVNNLDAISIEISNSLVVHQNIDVSGDLNMSCGIIDDVSMIVFCNDVSIVNDGTDAITVSGNLNVSGDLIVNNSVSLQDVSITNLSVVNNLDVSSVEISNSLVVHQNIDLSGDLNMSCGTIDDVSMIVFCNKIDLNSDVSSHSITIGNSAGSIDQSENAIAIGSYAGSKFQKKFSIAIGKDAGIENQGEYSIAIGHKAGLNDLCNNTIIINASDGSLNSDVSNALFINPIRNVANNNILYYNSTTKEITYNTSPFDLAGNLDMSCRIINEVSDIIFCNQAAILNQGTNDLTISGDLILQGNTQPGGSGQITLNCEYNSHGIKLKGPPHSADASYTLIFPHVLGTNNQFLQTDGSGNLRFADVSTNFYTQQQLNSGELDLSFQNLDISGVINVEQNINLLGNIDMSCGTINDVSNIVFCNDTAIVNEGVDTLTVSGDLILKGNGQTGGSGQITLNCEHNSHGVKIKGPPHDASASYTLTLPNDTGINGQFLQTDGSGNLSFAYPVDESRVIVKGTVGGEQSIPDTSMVTINFVTSYVSNHESSANIIANSTGPDISSIEWDNSTNTFTVAASGAGLYLVQAGLYIKNNSNWSNLFLYRNDFLYAPFAGLGTSPATSFINGSIAIDLDVGDYIDIRYFSKGSATTIISISGGVNNLYEKQCFSIAKISGSGGGGGGGGSGGGNDLSNYYTITQLKSGELDLSFQNIDLSGDLNMSCGKINDVSNIVFCNDVSLFNDGSNAITISGNLNVLGDICYNNTISLQDASITNLLVTNLLEATNIEISNSLVVQQNIDLSGDLNMSCGMINDVSNIVFCNDVYLFNDGSDTIIVNGNFHILGDLTANNNVTLQDVSITNLSVTNILNIANIQIDNSLRVGQNINVSGDLNMSCGTIDDVSAIIFCNDTAIVNESSNNLTISGDLILKGNTQTGNSAQITLNFEDNIHGVKIKGPPHIDATSYTLTLPNTPGTNGQFLRTDGTGVLSFADVSGSSSGGGGSGTGGLWSAYNSNINNIYYSKGKVAIGSDMSLVNPSATLHISGDVVVTQDITAFYSSSDMRLKTNIEQIEDPINIVEQLNGVSFYWNETAKKINGKLDLNKKEIGLIAQEVEKVVPEVVKPGLENYMAINYDKLTPLLIEAIKSQQKQIDELNLKIDKILK